MKSSDYGLASARTLAAGGGSLALLGGVPARWSRGWRTRSCRCAILRLRMLMGSSLVRGLLVTGMFSAFFLGSLYLERVLGYDAIQTGLAFMPLTIAIAAHVAGRLGAPGRALRLGADADRRPRRDHRRARRCSPARASGRATSPGLFVAFLLLGLGAGASFLPLLTIGMSDAPARDAGLASGIVNVSVQLFGAIGLATLGTIATDHTKALAPAGRRGRWRR